MAGCASVWRLGELKDPYPPADEVHAAAGAGQRERVVLARLWISEGIPFAFRNCPALYEESRHWLAAGLDLDAKEISVRGSGRLGYSLAPDRWGKPYRPECSDLDFFAVSESLFQRLRGDFERWSADFTQGVVKPSEGERPYWEDNRKGTPANVRRGFIDSWRVPNYPAYGHFSSMNRRLKELTHRLRETDAAPKPPKNLGLRCYKDWASYERQADLNLEDAARPVP